MNNGYVKKFRCIKAKDLKRNHPCAFLILDTVAENAKRKIDEGHPLLELSEAIITAEECGITPQQFETGLKILVKWEIIEILHRGRKDKNSKLEPRITSRIKTEKSRITSRINGTVVKLTSSEYYDINPEEAPNHIPNQNLKNPESHPEQRRNIKNKETKEEHKEKYKKEKIHPILENEETYQTAINQDFSETNSDPAEHNVYYQDEKAIQDIASKVKRRFNIETTKEEHINLIQYIEKKQYTEKGLELEFLELCYDELSKWKKNATAKQQKSCTDFGRITHWVAKEIKKSQLEDEEIRIKERRLKSYNQTNNQNKFQEPDQVDLIESRRAFANKFIIENWKKFNPESRPITNQECISNPFSNEKLYLKDPKFDNIFDSYMQKAMN